MPKKFGIPRQSGRVRGYTGKIIFEPEYRRAEALRGLEEYSHLWLIWEFSDLNEKDGKWRPTVRPPRLGGNKRVGVFATRSPYRPNPIGLSSVRIKSIDYDGEDAPTIEVEGVDLLDGTPIYDIKPYLPTSDCHPDAKGGFADSVSDHFLAVEISDELESVLPESIRDTVRGLLADDPRPSYQNDPERIYGFVFSGYDIKFRVLDDILTVTEIVKL